MTIPLNLPRRAAVMRAAKLTFFCFFTFPALYGQNGARILSGRVIDETSLPLAAIETILLKAGDSTEIQRGIYTNSAGVFTIRVVSPGDYLLRLRAMSNANKTHEQVITVAAGDVRLEDIVFAGTSVLLNAVEVRSTKPLIENQIDKTVINVDGNYFAKGDGILKVLQLAPGVIIDARGAIMVNGNRNVTITLKDKQVKLSGDALLTYLKGVITENVKSVEIISTPSSRYDAEGTAAIINIVPKRNLENGTMGSLSGNYGYTWPHTGIADAHAGNASASVTSKFDKLQLSGSAIMITDPKRSRITEDRRFLSTGERIQQEIADRVASRVAVLSSALVWEFDKKTAFGLEFSGNKAQTTRNATGQSQVFTRDPFPGLIVQSDYRPARGSQYNVGSYFNRDLDTRGSKLELKADYWKNADRGTRDFSSQGYFSGAETGAIDYVIAADQEKTAIIAGQADYTKVSRHGARLEAGVKVSDVQLRTSTRYDALKSNLAASVFGGEFEYGETVTAGYVNQQFPKVKNWTFQAGVRVENTAIATAFGDLRRTNQYLSIFPSGYVMKQFDSTGNHQLNVAYARRLSRPKYFMLNPIPLYNNPFSYSIGNPSLKPEFVDRIEATYSYKRSYRLNLSYEKYRDAFSSVTYQNDTLQLYYNSQENLASNRRAGMSLSFPLKYKKFELNGNVGGSYSSYKSNLSEGEYLDESIWNAHVRVSGSLDLARGFVVTGSYFHLTPFLSGQSRFLSRNILAFGVSKRFNDDLVLNVDVEDPFYINNERFRVQRDNQDAFTVSRWNSRRVSVSLSWSYSKGSNFNKKQFRKSNQSEIFRNSK